MNRTRLAEWVIVAHAATALALHAFLLLWIGAIFLPIPGVVQTGLIAFIPLPILLAIPFFYAFQLQKRAMVAEFDWSPSVLYYLAALPAMTSLLSAVYLFERRRRVGRYQLV
ncbi:MULTISPECIES: hypothetical protein [unclassified Haladaptatus]|uniref:hypothetical protein n=1 Tax=unclassified Haladaptatus TaxID=2622732 RepID=UPI0023E877F2|nr:MULTISPECIES: hypothetical protein [unclassified Haladaptatus]